MLKKTIEYVDFNGETVSEDFFFHLSKAELIEMELSHPGGLQKMLERIVAAQDGEALIKEFKNIILSAYGKRSEDGRRFSKNQEIRDEFISSPAYSDLFMELATNADAAIEFINGIIPPDLTEEAAKLTKSEKEKTSLTTLHVPEVRTVTRQDIEEMPKEDLEKLGPDLASGKVKIAE